VAHYKVFPIKTTTEISYLLVVYDNGR